MRPPTAPPTIGRRGVYILPSGTMFSGDFEAGEFASRGVIIYVDGGSYDGELDGRRSVPGPIAPTRLTLPPFQLLSPPEPEPARARPSPA